MEKALYIARSAKQWEVPDIVKMINERASEIAENEYDIQQLRESCKNLEYLHTESYKIVQKLEEKIDNSEASEQERELIDTLITLGDIQEKHDSMLSMERTEEAASEMMGMIRTAKDKMDMVMEKSKELLGEHEI